MNAESAVHLVIRVALVVGAAALLAEAVLSFVTGLDRGIVWASTHLLSVLLSVLAAATVLLRQGRPAAGEPVVGPSLGVPEGRPSR